MPYYPPGHEGLRRGQARQRDDLASAIMVGVVGMGALVAEYGLALEKQAEDQHIADAAAFAAATYYNQHGNSLTGALAAAQNVASLNGVISSCTSSSTTPPCVATSLATPPSNATANALKVSVFTSKPLYLASVVSKGASSVTVSGSAYAQLPGGVSDCVTALSTSSGVNLTGGTGINAPNCNISSAASISVPCGTTMTAKSVKYEGSTPSQCTSTPSITASLGMSKVSSVPDPLNSTAFTAPFLVSSSGYDAGLDRRVAHAGRDFGRNAESRRPPPPSSPTNNGTVSGLVQPEQLSDDHPDQRRLHGDIRILVQFLGHFLPVGT